MNDNLPAVYNPAVLSGQMEYAKAMAASDLLPRQYQGKPANLLWAISYGQTLGVAPLTAVQSIHVISGKPTASADLIAGLVRRAGHKLRISGNDRTATAQIIRADDPEFTFEATWTIERAQAAKLTGKDTWKSFPAAMLKARAITEVARAACSEILQGTIYTPEEMGANVGADGEPIEDDNPQPGVFHQIRKPAAPQTDEWTTPAPEQSFVPLRDFVTEVEQCTTADCAIEVYAAAVAAGAHEEVLGEIRQIGARLRAAEREAAEPIAEQPADEVVDAEVVSPEDDYAAAVAKLRAAAEAARLDMEHFEADAASALGMPLADASVDAIRALAQQINPTN